MTSKQLIEVEMDTLERLAFGSGVPIELGPDRAYLTIPPTTFTAPIPAAEQPSHWAGVLRREQADAEWAEEARLASIRSGRTAADKFCQGGAA